MSNEETEQFREFIRKLQHEEQRPSALNDFKNLIAYKPANEAVHAIQHVGFTNIFKCLNAQEKVQIDLTCDLLKTCFEKFVVGEVVKKYTGYIMFLLRHDMDCVRKLAVDEVYKTLVSSPESVPLPKYIDVFVAVAQLVTDTNVGVANKAILITSHLPLDAYSKVLEEMKIALDYPNNSKCNAYEVIINILNQSPELLPTVVDYGYIEHMLSELQSDDVLYQMNILELLSRFAMTPCGIRHLVENDALQRISTNIENLKSNPLGGLLTPGYLKFFGSIAHLYPRVVFDKYPTLLSSLFDAFDSDNTTTLPVALDTLGFIGTTIEGKLSLAALGIKYTQTIEKVSSLIRTGQTEIKIRALHCMANLIGYENDPNAPKNGAIDHRVTLMTREWFRSLSHRPECMEYLMVNCKNPFPDMRLAAFNLLDAACQHNWGQDLVSRTPGFIEYLLDRLVDHSKETKEAKYGVIKRLSRSAVFDSTTILKLTKFVEEGPFYSEANLQVAMEEGD